MMTNVTQQIPVMQEINHVDSITATAVVSLPAAPGEGEGDCQIWYEKCHLCTWVVKCGGGGVNETV